MSKQELKKDPITGDEIIHEFDGIQECDNALPKWWLYILYLGAISSFWYMGYYIAFGIAVQEVTGKPSPRAWSEIVYEADVAANKGTDEVDWKSLTGAALLEQINSPKMANRGKSIFGANCSACHAGQAQGLVGPNLTDNFWIHGGESEKVLTVVAKGVLKKGMPAWEGTLGRKDVIAVTAFLNSIRGTNVAGKEPQGKEYKP